MLRKLSRKLLLACLVSLTAGCAHHRGIEVTVYISDPAMGGMESFDQRTGKSDFVVYKQTDKFVCFEPDDLKSLLTRQETPNGYLRKVKAVQGGERIVSSATSSF